MALPQPIRRRRRDCAAPVQQLVRPYGSLGLLLSVALVLAITGCGGETTQPSQETNRDAGRRDGAAMTGFGERLPDGGCNRELSRISTDRSVSFRDDVLRVLSSGCTQSPCHDAERPKADLYLGPFCQVTTRNDAGADASPFDRCSYNLTHSRTGEVREETVLTDEKVIQVYENLVGVPSMMAPDVLRVAPGEPAESFLMHKVAGTHRDQGFECIELEGYGDDDHPCGAEMPPLGYSLCESSGDDTVKRRAEILAAWIAQGAHLDLDCPENPQACAERGGVCCGKVCSRLDTTVHCGACGVTCGAEQVCQDGVCRCTEGTMCDGVCRSLDTDPDHCGSCGRACGFGETCEAGACVFHGTTCGDTRCADDSYMSYDFAACCTPDGGCGLDLSSVISFLDPRPPEDCVPLDAPGALDSSCPSGSISAGIAGSFGPFPGCCAEGQCGIVVTDPFEFGCQVFADPQPCGD